MATLKQIRDALVLPSNESCFHPETAILRFHTSFNFCEYPRKELDKVFNELKTRVDLLVSGVDIPTATDRFLLELLMLFANQNPFPEKKNPVK